MSESWQDKWGKILQQFKSSNQKLVDLCRINEISYHKFIYWRKKLRATKINTILATSANNLKKIEIEAPIKPIETPLIKIIFPNGALITIPCNNPSIKNKLISNVLEVLC